MYCLNCGKELENSAKFCPHCGTMVGASAPQAGTADRTGAYDHGAGEIDHGQNVYPRPEPRKRGKGPMIAACLGAAALVVALAVVLVISGVFSGPKGKVAKAAAKSASAYTAAAKSAGLPDLTDLMKKQKFSQSGEIVFDSFDYGMSSRYTDVTPLGGISTTPLLEGLGVRFSSDYDLSGEKLAASVTPFYGSADLLTAEVVMDGSNLYLASPELTRGTYYGLDTMTLGEDLRRLGVDEEYMGDLSFNFFQFVQDMQEMVKPAPEDWKAIEKAGKTLYKAIEVTKDGSRTIEVNDRNVKCTAYTVMIPEDAIRDFLGEVEDVLVDSMDYKSELIDLFYDIGLPDEAMDELEYALDDADPKYQIKSTFDSIEETVDLLGDLELQVYISGGYIMAVTCEEKINSITYELGFYLGGGKNYVDDLSLVLRMYAREYDFESDFVLSSHGNHSAKGGAFTDETSLKYVGHDFFTSELSYDAKKKQDNFYWNIDYLGIRGINMEGQLTCGKNSMELDLDELEITADDQSITLRVNYAIGAYQGIPSVKSPVMLATLDEDDLEDIAYDIQSSISDWVYDLYDLMGEIPMFRYLF